VRHKITTLAVFCPLLALAADDAPGWLKDLTHSTVPQFGPKVNTVVLLNEENATVGDSGKVTTTSRAAVKILARQGVDVVFSEQYETNGGKVRDFHAWMIAPSGRVKKYGKEEILDVACASNDVYNECRLRLVSGKADAEPGAVFGYEATVEEQSFAQQLYFHFQDHSPVLLARFVVTVPAGWEIKSTSFNGAPKEAAATGATFASASIRFFNSLIGIGSSAIPAGRTGSDSFDTPATIRSSTGCGEGQSMGQSDSDRATRRRLPFLKQCAVK